MLDDQARFRAASTQRRPSGRRLEIFFEISLVDAPAQKYSKFL